jgi:ferritin-like metal-binding protein YciE
MTATLDSSNSNTVTAFFDDETDAGKAIDRIVEAGISRDKVRLVPGSGSNEAAVVDAEDKGLWHTLGSFFFPDEDREVYAEGLRRGGFLVTVTGLNSDESDVAVDILDDDGTIDINERADSWRAEGWSGQSGRAAAGDTASYSTASYDRTDGTLAGGNSEDTFQALRTPGEEAGSQAGSMVGSAGRLGRAANNASSRVGSYVMEASAADEFAMRDRTAASATGNTSAEPYTKKLSDLFYDTLRDVYFAENQIVKALPQMAEAAQAAELRSAFETHLQETKGQIKRLEQVFQIIGKSASGKTCEATLGILKEGKEVMEEYRGTAALDPGILSAAQAVEHYEISRYGTLKAWATQLGMRDAADLLAQTLAEEEKTDQLLSKLATSSVNIKAA